MDPRTTNQQTHITMPQLFGTIERNAVEDGQQIITFRIPAFSEATARRRARVNSRLKGFEDASITATEKRGSADVPGQSEYDITLTRPVS